MAASRVAGSTVKVRMNGLRHLLSKESPPCGHGVLTGRGRPGSSSPVRQMLLHFELGVAMLIADFLDVEEFMDAVGFDDHDKDPAFRIHGLDLGISSRTFMVHPPDVCHAALAS
jgi:hypothetical protein